jgi:hypothetical protein
MRFPGSLPASISATTVAGQVAESRVDGVDSVTLELTSGGRYFDDKVLFEPGSPVSRKQAYDIWGRLSERYAQSAEGNVTAYSHNPDPVSVWLTRERPALENNPKVTGINPAREEWHRDRPGSA